MRKETYASCEECQLSYCASCLDKHDKNESFATHETIKASIDEPSCAVHPGRRCTSYCTSCRTSLCAMCVLGEHDSDHVILDLKQATGTICQDLVKDVTSLNHATRPPTEIQQDIRLVRPELKVTSEERTTLYVTSSVTTSNTSYNSETRGGSPTQFQIEAEDEWMNVECDAYGNPINTQAAETVTTSTSPDHQEENGHGHDGEDDTTDDMVGGEMVECDAEGNSVVTSGKETNQQQSDTMRLDRIKNTETEIKPSDEVVDETSITVSQSGDGDKSPSDVASARVTLQQDTKHKHENYFEHSETKQPTSPVRTSGNVFSRHRLLSQSKQESSGSNRTVFRSYSSENSDLSSYRTPRRRFHRPLSGDTGPKAEPEPEPEKTSFRATRHIQSRHLSRQSSSTRTSYGIADVKQDTDIGLQKEAYTAFGTASVTQRLASVEYQSIVTSSKSRSTASSSECTTSLDSNRMSASMDSQRMSASMDSQRMSAYMDSQRMSASMDSQRMSASMDSHRISASMDSPVSEPRSRSPSPNQVPISRDSAPYYLSTSRGQSTVTSAPTRPKYSPPAVSRISVVRPLGVTNGMTWNDNLQLIVSTTSVSEPVQVYDYQGEKVVSYGRGVLMSAHGVTTDTDGRTAVIDRMMKTVKIFDANGTLVQSIKTAEFKGVMHVTLCKGGGEENMLAITDRVADYVILYDLRADQVVRRFGDSSGDSKWSPTEVTCSPDPCTIYVRDNNNLCIKTFDFNGYITGRFDTAGRYGNWSPRGVAIDTKNNLLVTDWNNRKVLNFVNDQCECYYSLSGVGRPYSVAIATGLMAVAVAKRYEGDIVKESDIEIYSAKQ